jgi:membrane-bound lytic murein transglycosylase A
MTSRHPIYRHPPRSAPGMPWHSRAEIETRAAPSGRSRAGDRLAVRPAGGVFLLQVQGSGRIRLTTARAIRVGFGGPERAPLPLGGAELVRRGIFARTQMTAAGPQAMGAGESGGGRGAPASQPVLHLLPRSGGSDRQRPDRRDEPPGDGPAQVAVDPDIVPLGLPVWIEKGGRIPMRRLMVAQDTGSAIKGRSGPTSSSGTGAEAGRSGGTDPRSGSDRGAVAGGSARAGRRGADPMSRRKGPRGLRPRKPPCGKRSPAGPSL